LTTPFFIDLTVKLQTPMSSGAAGASTFLADKVVVRNGLGEYIIPGSQVRGNVRHACERLLKAMGPAERLCEGPQPNRMCPQVDREAIPEIDDPSALDRKVRCCALCAIFGSPYFPSPIRFYDLICDNPMQNARNAKKRLYHNPLEARLGAETVRTMVSLNRKRRVAEEERLFFIETTPTLRDLAFHIRKRSWVNWITKGKSISCSLGSAYLLPLVEGGPAAWDGSISRPVRPGVMRCLARALLKD